MANTIIILGESGSGKSTSLKSLNPNETIIFNTLGKRLPFKGSSNNYNKDKKNIFQITDSEVLISLLKRISENTTDIKNIIIDDIIYIMRTEFFNNIKNKGYEKYNTLADNFRKIIEVCATLREDINIFLLFHPEPVEVEGSVATYKCASIGKLIDRMYNPLENVTMTLFAKPQYNEQGKPEYGFYTNKIMINGIEIPAKTPDGMFDEIFIPNDLNIVIQKMNEYYE